MFLCEKCGKEREMEVQETGNKPDPGRCRRERQCVCGHVCKTTEVSDAAYKSAVRGGYRAGETDGGGLSRNLGDTGAGKPYR